MRNKLVAVLGMVLGLAAFSAAAEGLHNPVVAAKDFSLDSAKGQVVYLDFWASWCSPCKASFPYMEYLRQAYEDDGLVVVAVNVDTDAAAAQRFMQQHNTAFTVVMDPTGSLAERFKVLGMPSSYLIDEDGKVLWEHKGFRPADRDMIEEQIQTALTSFRAATAANQPHLQPPLMEYQP